MVRLLQVSERRYTRILRAVRVLSHSGRKSCFRNATRWKPRNVVTLGTTLPLLFVEVNPTDNRATSKVTEYASASSVPQLVMGSDV